MSEEKESYRELGSTVEILRKHIKWKIEMLPQVAQEFNLSSATIEDLLAHLQSELDYFDNLPSDITLSQLIESHFERGTQVRKMIIDENK